MSDELTLSDIARALLWGRATSFETLADFLGRDIGDKKRLATFKKGCLRIQPDIENRFRVNEDRFSVAGGPGRRFPDHNPYKEGTIPHHIWESTKTVEWLGLGTIQLLLQPHFGIVSDSSIQEDINIFANPWHTENSGRSILIQTLDSLGLPQYQRELSIPEPIIEVCEMAWGVMPTPPLDDQGLPLIDENPNAQAGTSNVGRE